jgi:hypothetical protein
MTRFSTVFPTLIHSFNPHQLIQCFTLWPMNIELQNLPGPSKLIATMDKHPVGACLFVVALLICSLAAVGLSWLWFYPR